MRVGVWLVGARGSVATTVVVGAAAIRSGLMPPVGCVTETPDFAGAELPPLDALVFGGHDIADVPLVKRAEKLARDGVVPPLLPAAVTGELDEAEGEIREGLGGGSDAGTLRERADRLIGDLVSFRDRRELDRVVVINVASTEPPFERRPEHAGLEALERAMAEPGEVLPASSVYAYAALRAGCPYIDFTPSTGARLPALDELARRMGVPYGGSDAKTGETLVKTALAPMFAARALAVRSWSGTNLLGGGDGATLADPAAGESKKVSKDRALSEILDRRVEGQTHIDYVPHMGEWKTAWDHVMFEGFLGVRMTLQFTWQGCDSALAAPLVLDLARLTARAHQAGRFGPLPELGFFFKDPIGSSEHRLTAQYELLRAWAVELGAGA
ncbi:myo-inositol-1-phosphate synthase [Thermomonospora echinospora]|uniref:Myo-inositol-1-phosphate synthase n=1 Tax=Thermomonospora echinospora TaxID=1992 RepID=A0A1H5YX36_9ACTN|nr:inositol-3-phosphate synthase [Thermomonospora echinospora]SEG28594.1 myo-inositol-1-phosphate synthase [Thermomonospora echinospora]